MNPLTVVLNFVMLGSLALAIYFLQVAVHEIIGASVVLGLARRVLVPQITARLLADRKIAA